MQKDIKEHTQPPKSIPAYPPTQGGSKQQNNPEMPQIPETPEMPQTPEIPEMPQIPETPNTTLKIQWEWQKKDATLSGQTPMEYQNTEERKAGETGKVKKTKGNIW